MLSKSLVSSLVFVAYYSLYIAFDFSSTIIMLRDLVPLLLLGIAWAGPVQSGTPDSVYDFNPDMAEFYSKVSDYINSATDKSASCDVSTVSLPPDASGLPAPNATLKYVLLGIGTQVRT